MQAACEPGSHHITEQYRQNAQLGCGLVVAAFAVPVRTPDAAPSVASPAPASNPPRSKPGLLNPVDGLLLPLISRHACCPFAVGTIVWRRSCFAVGYVQTHSKVGPSVSLCQYPYIVFFHHIYELPLRNQSQYSW